MRLGERICQLRTQKQMSQGDLADALQVSRQSISKWETNSSVPELDKLIRLSEIFGVTLDELVTGSDRAHEQPEVKTAAGPTVVYVERPVKASLSAAQILGIILLSCSLLAFLLLVCVGNKFHIGEAVMLCLPVAVLGIVCLVTQHPLLWSCWCASAAWWIYVFILSARWEQEILLLIVGILLVAGSLIYTVCLHRAEKIHIPGWGWALLLLVLAAAAMLLAVNVLPPSFGVVEHTTSASPVESVPYRYP